MAVRVSTLRLAAPFAIAVSLLHAWSSQWWIGSMQDTAQVTTNGMTVAAALLVAGAALDMHRAAKRDSAIPLRSAARNQWVVMGTIAGAALVWAIASYALCLATNGAATLALSGTLTFPTSMVLLGALSLAAHVFAGLVLGRFLPLIAAVPLALFLSYAWNVALAYDPTRPAEKLTVLYDGLVTTGYGLRRDFVTAQAGWFTGVALALLAVLVLSVSGRGRLVARVVVAGATAIAVVAGVALTTDPSARAEVLSAPGHRTCADEGDGASVCVWEEHAYMLPALARMARQMTDASTGWRGEPVHLVEVGLAHGSGDVEVFLGGNGGDQYDLARTLATSVAAREFCGDSPVRVSGELLDRELWLMVRGLDDPTILTGLDDTQVPEVLRLDANHQWAWATRVRC